MKNLKKTLSNLEEEILHYKKEKNAVILSHFYQDEDIQDIADFVGDSLDLSKNAAKTKADVIVFLWSKIHGRSCKNFKPE